MKLACRSLTSAPPMRVPFNPAWSISMPALIPRGFLKMQPALWSPSGWLAFFTIHCFCIRLVSFCGSSVFQLKLALEDHQFVEAALPVGEDQLVALALDDFSGASHDSSPASPLADVAATAAGIAVQCAADRAGNADQRFQSRPGLRGRPWRSRGPAWRRRRL